MWLVCVRDRRIWAVTHVGRLAESHPCLPPPNRRRLPLRSPSSGVPRLYPTGVALPEVPRPPAGPSPVAALCTHRSVFEVVLLRSPPPHPFAIAFQSLPSLCVRLSLKMNAGMHSAFFLWTHFSFCRVWFPPIPEARAIACFLCDPDLFLARTQKNPLDLFCMLPPAPSLPCLCPDCSFWLVTPTTSAFVTCKSSCCQFPNLWPAGGGNGPFRIALCCEVLWGEDMWEDLWCVWGVCAICWGGGVL